MYMNDADRELLTRWRTAEFKGDYVCSLPIGRAQRLLDLLKHIPHESVQTDIRKRRGFRDGELEERFTSH